MNDADRIKDLVAEMRKLQDIIDDQADRILDLQTALKELLFYETDPWARNKIRVALSPSERTAVEKTGGGQ